MNKPYLLQAVTALSLFIALIVNLDSVVAATLKVPLQYSTINEALSAASPGDTVRVMEGTYFEHVTLRKGVTLEGGWKKDFSKRDVLSFVSTTGFLCALRGFAI